MRIKIWLWAAFLTAAISFTAPYALAEVSAPVNRCHIAWDAQRRLAVVSTTVLDTTTDEPVAGALIEWSASGHAMSGSTDVRR
jgi:hypothetical protein